MVWSLVGAVTLSVGCRTGERIAADDRAQLARGERVIDSLVTHARAVAAVSAPVSDADAITLGYLERLRLGFGSPFRLIELALTDARLPVDRRRPLAWALLARTAGGQGFTVDPAALGAPTADDLSSLTDGPTHQATIDSVVAAARDARTGEQTVRLAYALARAERLVPRGIAAAALPAAALARDRRLAREDATRLLDASARGADTIPDALTLVLRWRAARLFRVERPLLADDMQPLDALAAAGAERLLVEWRLRAATPSTYASRIDSADGGPAPAATVEQSPEGSAPPPTTAPTDACTDAGALFPCAAARRLAALPSVTTDRPHPAVVVSLGGFRLDHGATAAHAGERRRADASMRFVLHAHTPEALAARWAVARHTLDAPARAHLAARLHTAAVALRPFAQEPVRLATRRDSVALSAVALRTGVRAFTFDRQVPREWRGAVARELLDAVADLRLVFPALALDGAAVRIGDTPKRDSALALHDPRTRTIFLPPSTAAGTLAHEIVHDLDWQTARARFAVVGSYGTDRAARSGMGPLADGVRALAAARPPLSRALGAPTPGAPPSRRPAELLARSADWFTAAALARHGRMNGALTVAQDDQLVGYAGAQPAEPGDGTAESFVEALADVTPIAPATRSWFLARFGHGAPPSALTIARAALEAVPVWTDERTLRVVGLPAGLAPDPTALAFGRSATPCTVAPWHHRLLWIAADARARGILRAQAARGAGYGIWNWQARAVDRAPWRPDAAEGALARTRDAVLRAALRDVRARSPLAPLGCAL